MLVLSANLLHLLPLTRIIIWWTLASFSIAIINVISIPGSYIQYEEKGFKKLKYQNIINAWIGIRENVLSLSQSAVSWLSITLLYLKEFELQGVFKCEKVRNDTVNINEDFIHSVHHRPKHNGPHSLTSQRISCSQNFCGCNET